MSHESSILPSITSVIVTADNVKREEFSHQIPNMGNLEYPEIKEEPMDVDLSNVDANPTGEEKPLIRDETIKMIKKHYEFILASRNITTDQFLVAAAQLCHMDTSLAEYVWLSMFPKLWSILEEDQRTVSPILFRFAICCGIATLELWAMISVFGFNPISQMFYRPLLTKMLKSNIYKKIKQTHI